MDMPRISRRGVYYDLSISPYEFKTPYGDILKFSSKKRLEIYTRRITDWIARIDGLIERHSYMGEEWANTTRHSSMVIYGLVYKEVER